MLTVQHAHHLAYQITAPIGQQLGGGAHVYKCEAKNTRAHCLASIDSPWQELRLRVRMHQMPDGTVRYSIRHIEVVEGPQPDPAPVGSKS